jgi:DNA ligase (NAD+)
LHNFDNISQKDIKMGDWVWVQRSGEVIPYITSVIVDRRDDTQKTIDVPQKCPVCDSNVIKLDTEVYYYCSNINCPAQIKEKLIHFVSRDCMNIDGL